MFKQKEQCSNTALPIAMISQPMRGKTDEEIKETREKAIATLESKGYQVVNTLFTDEWYSKEAMEGRGEVQIPVYFLSKSIENMSLCHAAYFCAGWEDARGCRIEHDIAEAYGLEILYESEPEEQSIKSITLTKDVFSEYEHKAVNNYLDMISKKMFEAAAAEGKDINKSEKAMFTLYEMLSAIMVISELKKLLFGQEE